MTLSSNNTPQNGPDQALTYAPTGREKIDWKLITNLPVRSRMEATEKLDWYAQRWKIETFHD
jgi:hypothetical protein